MADSFSGLATAGDIVALPSAAMAVRSVEILRNAIGSQLYAAFAVQKLELNRLPGTSILMTRYGQITRGGSLAEDDSIESRSMTSSQVSITIGEWGNAVAFTEALLRANWDDTLEEATIQLSRDYGIVRDLYLRDIVSAGGSTLMANPDAAGVGALTSADTFDVECVRRAVEALETANAPKYENSYYACIVHPHQAISMRRDPDWISAHTYINARPLFNGEIGRFEDVIFLTTTNQGNGAAPSTDAGYDADLDGTGAGGINLYRATFLADQAFGVADALPVEMRDGGLFDFGRKRKIAWYAIWGGGILNNNHIVNVITA